MNIAKTEIPQSAIPPSAAYLTSLFSLSAVSGPQEFRSLVNRLLSTDRFPAVDIPVLPAKRPGAQLHSATPLTPQNTKRAASNDQAPLQSGKPFVSPFVAFNSKQSSIKIEATAVVSNGALQVMPTTDLPMLHLESISAANQQWPVLPNSLAMQNSEVVDKETPNQVFADTNAWLRDLAFALQMTWRPDVITLGAGPSPLYANTSKMAGSENPATLAQLRDVAHNSKSARDVAAPMISMISERGETQNLITVHANGQEPLASNMSSKPAAPSAVPVSNGPAAPVSNIESCFAFGRAGNSVTTSVADLESAAQNAPLEGMIADTSHSSQLQTISPALSSWLWPTSNFASSNSSTMSEAPTTQEAGFVAKHLSPAEGSGVVLSSIWTPQAGNPSNFASWTASQNLAAFNSQTVGPHISASPDSVGVRPPLDRGKAASEQQVEISGTGTAIQGNRSRDASRLSAAPARVLASRESSDGNSHGNDSHAAPNQPSGNSDFEGAKVLKTSAPQKLPQIQNVDLLLGQPGVLVNRAAASDRPSEMLPRTDQTRGVPPVTPMPSSPARPVRDMSLRLTGAESRVDVQVSERSGRVQVAVRTADQDLAKSLQSNLGELVGHLEMKGFRTDAWTSTSAVHSGLAFKETAAATNSKNHSDDSGYRGGQADPQGGRQDSNQRQNGRWKSLFEESIRSASQRIRHPD